MTFLIKLHYDCLKLLKKLLIYAFKQTMQPLLRLNLVRAIQLQLPALDHRSSVKMSLSASGKTMVVVSQQQPPLLIDMQNQQQTLLVWPQETSRGKLNVQYAQFTANGSQIIVGNQFSLSIFDNKGQFVSTLLQLDTQYTRITDLKMSPDRQILLYLNQSQFYSYHTQSNTFAQLTVQSQNNFDCQASYFIVDRASKALFSSSYQCLICAYQLNKNILTYKNHNKIENCRLKQLNFLNSKQIAMIYKTPTGIYPEIKIISKQTLISNQTVTYDTEETSLSITAMRQDLITYTPLGSKLWLSHSRLKTLQSTMDFSPWNIKNIIFDQSNGRAHIAFVHSIQSTQNIQTYEVNYQCKSILGQNVTKSVDQGYSSTCQCADSTKKFSKRSLKCQPTYCNKDSKGNCICNSQQSFDTYSLSCTLNCSKIHNSLQSIYFGQPPECPCAWPFAWNRQLSDCSLYQCGLIQHSLTQKIASVCSCIASYQWMQQPVGCWVANSTAPGVSQSGGLNALAVVGIVFAVIAAIVLSILMYVFCCRKAPEDEIKAFQIKTIQEIGTNRAFAQKIPKAQTGIQLKKAQNSSKKPQQRKKNAQSSTQRRRRRQQ